ncbi:MAG: metalloregulator ArsR/SmtB family transcription factor [Proteobacteria bacterium]|nr:metalloregulator ArsR/SmtB family transcription factor [Pseudomonadota bacterium]
MVKYQSTEHLDRTFSALADPTRRAILARLSTGSASVGQLAEPFDISLPAISRHLRALEAAGLLIQHKEGRVRRCVLNAQPLNDAAEWIETNRRFWESQFDSLSRYLDEQDHEESSDGTGESADQSVRR